MLVLCNAWPAEDAQVGCTSFVGINVMSTPVVRDPCIFFYLLYTNVAGIQVMSAIVDKWTLFFELKGLSRAGDNTFLRILIQEICWWLHHRLYLPLIG